VNIKVNLSLTILCNNFPSLLTAVLTNHGLSITYNRKTCPSEAFMLARGVRMYLPRVES
jgi:hypothetical protein